MRDQIIEPYREVAAAILIGTCGRYLYQQRDDIPGLMYAGMIGLFGGHREGTETPLECAQREIHEETGITFPPEQFRLLVQIDANFPAGGGIKGSFYLVRDVPIDQAVITEGQPRILVHDDLPSLLHRMTPSACYVTRLFLGLK